MKNRKFIWGSLLLAGIAVATACNSNLPDVTDDNPVVVTEKSTDAATTYCDSLCTYTGVLTDADIAGIMEMREEEKLAHDVYVKFYDLFGKITFKNISKSEAVHSAAVLRLIDGYKLDDPALDGDGEFSNPLFSDLYTQLNEKGSVSLVEALKIGAFIEEYDINDLMKLLDETDNADVTRVYTNLLKGSTFHLKSFSKLLKVYGVTYTPTVISEELYLSIINSTQTDDGTSTGTTTTWTCPNGK